jgi:hypothetical protein
MTRWEACLQLCSARNCSQWKTLLLNCLLDGEACGRSRSTGVSCATSPTI